MNKAELLKQISKDTGVELGVTRKVFNSMVTIIQDSLFFGLDIKIKNFINLTLEKRKEKVMRNPKTGEEIVVPKHYYVRTTLPFVFKKRIKTKKVY